MRHLSRLRNTTLIALLLWAGHVRAADMTVFGIPLGARLQVPECEKRLVGSSVIYMGSHKVMCFERIGSDEDKRVTTPVINDSVLINFPIQEIPAIMKGLGVVGNVLDGNLEGIGFNTSGVSGQSSALSALTEKYGKPTTLTPKQVKNQAGGTFDTFDAFWGLADLEIVFQGVTSRIDTGLVNIDTKKGAEDRKRKLLEITSRGRRL